MHITTFVYFAFYIHAQTCWHKNLKMEYVHNSNTHPMLHCIFTLLCVALHTFKQTLQTRICTYVLAFMHAHIHDIKAHFLALPIYHAPSDERGEKGKTKKRPAHPRRQAASNHKRKTSSRHIQTWPWAAVLLMFMVTFLVLIVKIKTYLRKKMFFLPGIFLPGLITIPKKSQMRTHIQT
jgi:hypothetical protein